MENQENFKIKEFLFSRGFLSIILVLGIILIIIFNTFIFYYLSNKIESQNDYIVENSTFCYKQNNNTKDLFEKRVENLEQKNIDVFASKETINFWMTFFAVLLPVILGFFIYQKGKFEDKAEGELNEVKKAKKEALEEINILKKSQEKLKNDFDKSLTKYKEQAQDEFKKIIKEAENQREINNLFNDALKFYQDGNYDSTIKNYDKLIKIDYKNTYGLSVYFNNRGNAYSALKKYEKAIENFDEAIKINPKEEAYYNRGNAYFDIKSYEKAIEDYDEAIKINMKKEEAYNNRGNAYFELKSYEKAIESYDEAIKINPKKEESYYNRGNAYFELKSYEKAIESYDEAIKINPQHEKSIKNRLICYKKLKEKQQEENPKKS